MAVDILQVCAESDEASAGVQLAVLMCALFSVYVIAAVVVAALAIYSATERGTGGAQGGGDGEAGMRSEGGLSVFASAGAVVPLMHMRPMWAS